MKRSFFLHVAWTSLVVASSAFGGDELFTEIRSESVFGSAGASSSGSGNSLPDPIAPSSDEPRSEDSLVPIAGHASLAEALRNADFDPKEVNSQYLSVEIETEDVLLFNPTGSSVDVTVTFTFSDGTRIVENKSLASLEVEDVDGEIEFDEGFSFPADGLDFTISITSTGPIVAMLEHWNPLGRAIENTALGVPTGTVLDLVDIAVF